MAAGSTRPATAPAADPDGEPIDIVPLTPDRWDDVAEGGDSPQATVRRVIVRRDA